MCNAGRYWNYNSSALSNLPEERRKSSSRHLCTRSLFPGRDSRECKSRAEIRLSSYTGWISNVYLAPTRPTRRKRSWNRGSFSKLFQSVFRKVLFGSWLSHAFSSHSRARSFSRDCCKPAQLKRRNEMRLWTLEQFIKDRTALFGFC